MSTASYKLLEVEKLNSSRISRLDISSIVHSRKQSFGGDKDYMPTATEFQLQTSPRPCFQPEPNVVEKMEINHQVDTEVSRLIYLGSTKIQIDSIMNKTLM